METGCRHPDAEVVTLRIDDHGRPSVRWCPLCGSVHDTSILGLHGAAAGTWRPPSAIVLPGWTCGACGVLNGCLKELLTECRSCDRPRLTTDTTQCTDGDET